MVLRAAIVGDIHGCLAEARQVLAELRRRGLQRSDELILLGDLVDKGPDPAGVVRFFRQERDAGQRTVLILGNHEEKHARWRAAVQRERDGGAPNGILDGSGQLADLTAAPRLRVGRCARRSRILSPSCSKLEPGTPAAPPPHPVGPRAARGTRAARAIAAGGRLRSVRACSAIGRGKGRFGLPPPKTPERWSDEAAEEVRSLEDDWGAPRSRGCRRGCAVLVSTRGLAGLPLAVRPSRRS